MKKMVLCYDNNSYVIAEREIGERICLFFKFYYNVHYKCTVKPAILVMQ